MTIGTFVIIVVGSSVFGGIVATIEFAIANRKIK